MTRESAVRFYAPDHPSLAVKAVAMLRVYLEDQIEKLPYAADWSDFQYRKGQIMAIQSCVERVEDLEKQLSER